VLWVFLADVWDADELGLAVARLVVALLVPAGEPVTVAIDDTLFRRRGNKVGAAPWFQDGSAPGPAKTGYGNNWVIAVVVVRLLAVRRPAAIPVLAKLVIKDTSSGSRLWLGPPDDRNAGRRAARPPHPRRGRFRLRRRRAEETADRRELDHPAAQGRRPVRAAAAAHRQAGPAPAEGRPLPSLASLAATTVFTPVTVTRYGKAAAISAAALTCLWPSVFGTRRVSVVLIRDRQPRHRRARPRRRGRSPGPRPLVRQQGPAVDRRHGRKAPPRYHRRQI
jgi:hypothetical protein